MKEHLRQRFEGLLHKSNDISSHPRNIHMLMIEIYKIKKKKLAPQMKCYLVSEICKSFSQEKRELFLWSRDIKLSKSEFSSC